MGNCQDLGMMVEDTYTLLLYSYVKTIHMVLYTLSTDISRNTLALHGLGEF